MADHPLWGAFCGVLRPRKNNKPLPEAIKLVIFRRMHFSTHIATLHSTFSLLAALLLRGAR